ncbi:MAG: response regulator transcription factor [Ferruginibacter sp.]|nr:response regulator transcription factor [Bacteroidota bacterium]MBX2934295.1 response regulator transcription factor [Ferruginibacter sp.]
MENNKIIKFKGNILLRATNAIEITNKLLNIDLRKIHILHFDDHKLFLKGMELYLRKYFPNLTSEKFTNSQTALNYIKTSFKENIHLDLIITGLNQRPDINGYEFAKAVREIEKPANKRTYILLVSMYDLEFPLIKRGLEEKIFDKYFPKSADLEIIESIKLILGN